MSTDHPTCLFKIGKNENKENKEKKRERKREKNRTLHACVGRLSGDGGGGEVVASFFSPTGSWCCMSIGRPMCLFVKFK
jgi:hypothetical protein